MTPGDFQKSLNNKHDFVKKVVTQRGPHQVSGAKPSPPGPSGDLQGVLPFANWVTLRHKFSCVKSSPNCRTSAGIILVFNEELDFLKLIAGRGAEPSALERIFANRFACFHDNSIIFKQVQDHAGVIQE